MKSSTIRNMCLCGLFSALTAAFSQIQFSIGPIPFSMAPLAVLLSGALLGWKYGATSQLVYALLGLIGAPVFAGFKSGPAIVFGKTGGYIIGYILCALIVGLAADKCRNHFRLKLVIAMIIGLLVLYSFGTVWYIILTGCSLWQSLVWCVFPFLPADAVKIAIAALLSFKLRKVIHKNTLTA